MGLLGADGLCDKVIGLAVLGDNLLGASWCPHQVRDENREVNHHGRVRTLGEEGEEMDEDDRKVLQNNWVDENFALNLVSRKEDVQVKQQFPYLIF